jgi:hypothetical protein
MQGRASVTDSLIMASWHLDVEFLPTDPFTAASLASLARAGAQPALEIRDRGRLVGRVWSFRRGGATVMDVEEAAGRWDRVGHLSQLFRQSLAGTSFEFGYAWPRP